MANAPLQGWKIDKHIPVAVIAAFFAQAVIYGVIAVWVASKYDSRLMVLEEFKVRSATERENDNQRIKGIELEVPVIREKMQNIERSTDRIEKKLDKLSLIWPQRHSREWQQQEITLAEIKALGEIEVIA